MLDKGVIDLDLQGHLAILNQDSKKRHSVLPLCTDLGRTRGVTRSNVLLCQLDKISVPMHIVRVQQYHSMHRLNHTYFIL